MNVCTDSMEHVAWRLHSTTTLLHALTLVRATSAAHYRVRRRLMPSTNNWCVLCFMIALSSVLCSFTASLFYYLFMFLFTYLWRFLWIYYSWPEWKMLCICTLPVLNKGNFGTVLSQYFIPSVTVSLISNKISLCGNILWMSFAKNYTIHLI